MCRAERVVDVGVDPVDELGDERRVVALLARIEAQVLEQLDAGSQLGQPGPNGIHRVRSSGLPFGRPRWLGGDDGRARARAAS